jgi:predicted enzyme related to lactoylglutathione lyase
MYWMDLADGDVTFYAELFGWRASAGVFTVDGQVVAGYGAPGGAGWNLHAVVDDVAGTGHRVVTDPTGATFVIRNEGPTAALLHKPHTFSWAELCTPDPATAIPFYRALFGWDTVDITMELPSGPIGYTVFLAGQDEAAGLMPATEPRWLAYVESLDADLDAKRAAELGGTVVVEPFDVPRIGRITVLAGRSGETFALMEMPR